MSTPTSSVSGLVSGIDWESTIAQLMQIERRRVSLLETRKSENDTKLNLWSQIQSKVAALQGVAEGMDKKSEFAVKAASSSDATRVGVSATAAAAEGAHTVEVLSLAKSHRLASQGWADKSTTGVGDSGGDLVIEINGNTITISDADLSSDTTLEQLRNLINSSADNDGYVTASILDDGSDTNNYRLVITADDTGADNEIIISSNPTNLDFANNSIDDAETETNWTGTSAITTSGTYSGTTNKQFFFTIAGTGTQTIGSGDITVDWVDSLGNTGSILIPNGYSGSAISVAEGVELSFGAGDLEAGETFSVDVTTPELTAAQDAQIRIDSIYMSKDSNSITDVLEGVTIDLMSAEAGEEIEITINNDVAAVKNKIQALVDAYNSLVQDISTFTAYDEENESAAPLLGDGFLTGIRSSLASIVSAMVVQLPDSATYDSLASAGVLSSTRGLLTIDDDALDEALENNFDDIVDLFTESFSSEDGKIFLAGTNNSTQGGEYSLVVNYDGSGQMTSATINGVAAVIDGDLIHGGEGTAVEGLVLGFTSPGTGPGSVNTTIRIGKGASQMIASEASRISDPDEGTIQAAKENLQTQNENLDRQIESWERRLTEIESQYKRQFAALETTLSRLSNQSNYLAGVL
ncbi:flagellar filament capping protein FliD [bacterium]|nr:flagellar filament capping protein FliD [bacterium]